LWLSLGGFPEKIPSSQTTKRDDKGNGNEKVYNTHIVLDDKGDIKALYRKIHLFDVNIPNGPVLQESKYTAPGSEVVVIDSPIGRLGLSTCYDLRFPEMYEALVKKGAEVLLVPSAFTVLTGQAHWEILLRARAIETQCYVLASAQAGQHNEKRASYGHSLIVDPWGKVVEDAGGEASPALVVAEIDLKRLYEIRAKIPVQLHRRQDVF
jgi:predicted amidohydrolase